MRIMLRLDCNYFPLDPLRDTLTLIYGRNNIPREVNLLNGDGTKRKLNRFTQPFKGSRRNIEIWCGRDLDKPLLENFEKQLDKFVKDVLEIHWDKSVKIPEAFITVLKRVGRSGCLYRLGFRPKTEEEIEQKKQIEEQKRIKAEKIIAEKNKLRKIAIDKYDELDDEDKRFLQMDYDCSCGDKYFTKYFGTWEDYLRYKFGLFVNKQNFKKIMGGKYDSNQLS